MGRNIHLKNKNENIIALNINGDVLSFSNVNSTNRSNKYMNLLNSLDIKGLKISADEIKIIQNALKEELGNISSFERLVGIISRCNLGPEFNLHSLNLSGGIVKHYKVGEHIPQELSPAIPYALNNTYSHIEVYSDRLICIYPNGSTNEISLK